MMVVSVQLEPSFRPETTKRLFEGPYAVSSELTQIVPVPSHDRYRRSLLLGLD